MKKFSPYNNSLENFVYLVEKKLTHLEHIEDAIFDDGFAGGIEALRMMNGIINTLQGNSKKGVNVQSKVDGSPSIIAGTNPENGKFFVATKALFNKTPKICYTDADIDKNHGHAANLVTKMKVGLKYFQKLGIKGIVQGDFMFLPSDLTKETIDDSDYITFRPNTITYAVPTDDPFADVIQAAKVGVIWHTSYSGATIADLSAKFKVNVTAMTKTKDVWAGDTDFRDVSGRATLTKSELAAVRLEMKKASESLKKLNKKALKILFHAPKEDDTISFNVKIYINDMISQGEEYSNKQKAIGGFINFIRKRYQPKIDKLKSEKGKAKKQKALDDMINTLNSDRNIGGTFAYALEWHNNVGNIKLGIIKKMEQVNSIAAFNKTSTGYEVTGPEGFVAVDHMTNSAVKLVNRLEFSKNNFNAIKNWGS
tara:strand:- start:228 stop:1499 length:1272 start_codon:yes stop_codon:yes gene_type:complete